LKISSRKTLLTALSLGISLTTPVALSVVISVCATQSSALAQSSTTDSASVSDSLAKLEKRLFEFTYASEDDDARLNRLENFVFGSKQTGSVTDRLAHLQAAIVSQPAADNGSAGSAATGQTATNSGAESTSTAGGTGNTTSSNSNTNAVGGANTSGETYPTFDYANYPRVTELEQQLLGTSYPHDALPDRLNRLETKAFGKPAASQDLAQRVDSLDRYAQRHDIFHERPSQPVASSSWGAPSSPGVAPAGSWGPPNGSAGSYGAGSYGAGSPPGWNTAGGSYGAGTSSAAASNNGNQLAYGAPPPVNQFSPDVQGIDQRVATMEQSVFGQSYSNRPLADRVSRLEKKMVPYEHNLGSNDLPTRVDHLWTILSVAHTLQNSPTAANQSNMMAANQQAPPDYNYGAGTNNAQYPNNNTASAPASPQHSWLHKLGKVASVAGRMAAGSMMGGMGGGYGFFP
jgi:hypothetical protein